MFTNEENARGAAYVGLAISQALLSTLRAKKILTDEEANSLLDGVLEGLENTLDTNDRGVHAARQIVELILSAPPPPQRGERR
jgi:hypothetical protein